MNPYYFVKGHNLNEKLDIELKCLFLLGVPEFQYRNSDIDPIASIMFQYTPSDINSAYEYYFKLYKERSKDERTLWND